VVHLERARRELLAIGDTVRARSVETRDDLTRGCRLGYGRDLHHDARCPPGVLGLAGDLGALGPADVAPHAI
jgi:hypothetical protein